MSHKTAHAVLRIIDEQCEGIQNPIQGKQNLDDAKVCMSLHGDQDISLCKTLVKTTARVNRIASSGFMWL